ncbi:hypothetical protein [Kocuria rosea]|uniref:hypothetical protein n=1 Tax=Kocuria rosea TaxID=1275 RepID=UPI000F831C81|nr:hypothetical protein [Kocuria rosea]
MLDVKLLSGTRGWLSDWTRGRVILFGIARPFCRLSEVMISMNRRELLGVSAAGYCLVVSGLVMAAGGRWVEAAEIAHFLLVRVPVAVARMWRGADMSYWHDKSWV